MQLTKILLLSTAALAGVEAAVHGHHHNKRNTHVEERSDFLKAIKSSRIKSSKAVTTVASAAAVATSATATTEDALASAADEVAAAVSSVVSSVVSEVYQAFCSSSSGVSRRATAAEIAYVGNTGTTDDYGCNIMEISSSIKHMYEYTLSVTNVASEAYEFICWPKIGKDGGIDGFFKGYGEALIKTIPAGESITVAFEANSQGACAFAPGSVPTSSLGLYQGTWFEYDYCNESNNGWSGCDCSALTSADTGGSIYGCKACTEDDSTCSIIYSDGTGSNAYTAGTNALDGVGINSVAGNVTYNLAIGYSK